MSLSLREEHSAPGNGGIPPKSIWTSLSHQTTWIHMCLSTSVRTHPRKEALPIAVGGWPRPQLYLHKTSSHSLITAWKRAFCKITKKARQQGEHSKKVYLMGILDLTDCLYILNTEIHLCKNLGKPLFILKLLQVLMRHNCAIKLI